MSQTTQILAHLKEFGSITPLDALANYGCFRLAARIWELRDAGEPIRTEKNKPYGRYIYEGDLNF